MADNEMKLDAAQSEPGGRPAGNNLPPLPADAIAIMPVREMVLFPGVVLPVTVGRQRSIAAAQSAVREQRQVGILMQRDGEQAEPQPIDLHRIGTVANIVRYVTAPDGTHHLVCQGEQRFQVGRVPERLAVLRRARAAHPRAGGSQRRRSRRACCNLQRQARRGAGAAAAGAAGADRRRAERRLARRAGRPCRRLHGPQAGREAGDPRDDRRLPRAWTRSRAAGAPHRGAAPVAGDRPADQGRARRAPARGAAARADGGDPAAARRGRAEQGAGDRRADRGDRQGGHAEGGRGPGAQGAAPPGAHARSRGRIRHDRAPISTG